MLRRLPTLVLLLAVVLPLAACWEEKQPATWKSATGTEALEKLVWDEVKAKNWPEIERHVGVNYVAVGPPGVLNREQLVAHLKQFEIDEYALGNVQVTPNGADMMVTYDFTAHGKYGQFIFVSPDNDVVIVRNGVRYGVPGIQWMRTFSALASRLGGH